ncbi:MAG: prolyl oligopeptidase family protein, partial [Planctomycetota bacterium]
MRCFKKTLYVSLAVLCFLYGGCKKAGRGERAEWIYPSARKDSAVDVYHGVEVADPYRWLEDAESAETGEWVEQQNKLSGEFVSSFGRREAVRKRLEHLWNYAKYSSPWKKGGRYFYRKNDGLQNQSVLYVQESLKGEPAVVINPNLLSEDGTIALSTTAVSEDGRLLAYGLSASGSDEKEIKVLDIGGGREYGEVLKWCKFTSIAWRHDGSGFYYDRFPEPNSVAPEDRNNYNRVYWHKLGTEQSEDPLVYERPEEKELGFSPMITEDGEFLILVVYHGTDVKNRVYYRRVSSEGDFVRLLDEADARYEFIGNTGGVFYFHTDLGAARGRIIAIDIGAPGRENWREVVGEQEDVIDYAAFINNHFVVAYLRDVCHKLRVYDSTGAYVKEISLPGIGRVSGLWGREDDSEMFFSFSSFLFASTSYRYDFADDKPTVFQKPQIDFDASGYETKQVFYDSKDGTRVPMFITHKKGLVL